MPYLLLYLRIAMARVGLTSLTKLINDERAVQKLRRGRPEEVLARRIDLARHSAERRGVALMLVAYTSFLGWLVSNYYGPRWLTISLLVAAVGLFVASMSNALRDSTRGSATADSQAVGRNAPCPCGSGKRYKHCHGAA